MLRMNLLLSLCMFIQAIVEQSGFGWRSLLGCMDARDVFRSGPRVTDAHLLFRVVE
jgi:hypothetical protein